MPCWRFQALYKIREPFTIYGGKAQPNNYTYDAPRIYKDWMANVAYIVFGWDTAHAQAYAYGPTPTDRPVAWGDSRTHLWKNVIIFVTTTPIDMKTNRSPGHGRHASACQIWPAYDAAFRRSLETEKTDRRPSYWSHLSRTRWIAQ